MVKGRLYPSFQATCVAQGLLEDYRKWSNSFEKASLFAFRKILHALFATSLVHRSISDLVAIWNQFANKFCDDLPYQLQDWPNIPENLINPHYDYGLYLLSELLKESGKHLNSAGFL